MSSPPIFTASQIALTLGVSANAVKQRLADVPCGYLTIRGQKAKAWAIATLPPDLCAELAKAAQERGYREPEQMLQEGFGPWRPPIPWEDIPAIYQREAEKLRQVFAPILSRPALSNKEHIELSGVSYRQVFGHPVKSTRLQYIIDRAGSRDKGFKNWNRPELYLDDAAFKPRLEGICLLPAQELLGDLDLDNLAKPTEDDRADIFHFSVLPVFEALQSQRKEKPSAIKRLVINSLNAAVPALAKNLKALCRVFEIKYKKWTEGGRTRESIMSTRPAKSGNRRTPDFSQDDEKVKKLAVVHDANPTLAHRKARQAGDLSPELEAYHPFDGRRSKSGMSKKMRARITPIVRAAALYRKGEEAAKRAGPYRPRDWSDTKPGDYFSGDDVCWNHAFTFIHRVGTKVSRGECLLLTDFKSGFPIEFLLIAGPYNSEHVRQLLLQANDKVGLPHVGVFFENGVWRAKMIPGEYRKKDRCHWRETESLGLDFQRRHAQPGNARAKPIEAIFRIAQDRMRCIPGFLGFNERTDAREMEQAIKQRAEKGDLEAISKLPTMEEWRNTIRTVLEEFAHDPQNGVMNPGISPDEAWQDALSKRPLRKLAPEDRWKLATHEVPARVTVRGILLTIRGRRMLYCNEHTGELLKSGGIHVRAFYNVELPELLTISDLKRERYYSVKRILLPATTATKEQFEEVNRAIKAHCQPAKILFGEIKHQRIATISTDTDDEAGQEFGRFVNEQAEAHKAEVAERERKLRKIDRRSDGHGLASSDVRDPDQVLAAQAAAEQYRAQLERDEAEGDKT